MPSARHEFFIAEFAAEFPAARTRGFTKALMKICAGEGEGPATLDQQIRPDLFEVNRELHAVVCWEMIDGHRTTPLKVSTYEDLAWVLNDHGWTLMLIEVDCNTGGSKRTYPIEQILERLAVIGRSIRAGVLMAGFEPSPRYHT